MPLYSLKVQTLVARWKHFRSSSSAIFMDDAVPQWVLYCVWAQEEVRSVIRVLWAEGTAPIETHCEIQAIYGSNVMSVQHVRKWCREFSDCSLSVTDEQRKCVLPHQQILSLQLRRLCVLIAEYCLKSWKNSLIFHMAQSGTLFTNV